MHKDNLVKIVKATIISVIVALLIVFIILFGVKLFLGQKIDLAFMLIDRITIIRDEDRISELPVLEKENRTLKHYPEYGTKYADIAIEKIGVNLPVYFGDKLEILKNGVGHDSGSYFPGEGGSILYMGHNFDGIFRRLGELEIGDNIKVKTSYGEFTYEVYDMKIVKENEKDVVPIQREEEILMIYTCYPFNNIGYTTQRYIVYSKIIDEVIY